MWIIDDEYKCLLTTMGLSLNGEKYTGKIMTVK